MQFKLAFKNVRKRFRDYTIYFLTIALGVCLFYVFNSLDSQTTMDLLSGDKREYYQLLISMISGVSIFVSIILAFLIIYANKFLIKRRKKEISVYMLLGMDKSKISATLVIETLLTGLLALVVGIAVGIFASQGLSVIVANMFKANLSKFHFSFSTTALLKTLAYFGIIFVIVIIFNVINISRCKLITLIHSARKSESDKARNLPLSIILFIISVGCLIFAYNRITINGFMNISRDFWMAIGFGAAGTFLFFFSVSGLINVIVKSNKRLYYRHLNIFTFRQFTSKINTNCISISLICLMLLMTIGVLGSANGVNSAMNSVLDKANPQDATYTLHKFFGYEINENGDIIYDAMEKENEEKPLDFTALTSDSKFADIAKDSVFISKYFTDIVLSDYAGNIDNSPYGDYGYTQNVTAYRLSDYNKVMKFQGNKQLTLNENEYAVLDDTSMKDSLYDVNNMSDITLFGKKLSYVGGKILDQQISNSPSVQEQCVIVVNDDLLSDKYEISRNLLVNYKNKDCEYKFRALCDDYAKTKLNTSLYITKIQALDSQTGISVIATFTSLYIGIIFLITSCAVLALQQLSESTDNAERYKLLRKLGASSKDINKALFQQIAAYFFMPLVLAVVHSIVGINAASNMISLIGQIDIMRVAVITGLIIVLVYGGYFLMTYQCSKSIIKK